ncbi:MAG: (Fe-S)-binding protein [Desulfobacterales bacterium]|nr:(Fe-S)-binding protein [Desulfobacterales bacterium]
MKDTPEITLFIQCLVDSLYPEAGEAMVRLFHRLGIDVTCPDDQTCCGQPAFNSGYWTEAGAAARRFIEIFEGCDTPIVCPSGSCVDMVRNHYPDLFRDDPEWLDRARRIGARTFEFTEYLVDVLGVTDVGAAFEGSVTYHDSCHLNRAIGVSRQPRVLIEHVKGCRLVEMKDADRCCGFGGTFSVNYPEISTAMVDEKVDNILASGADVVVGCDISCLMNIQGRISRRNLDLEVMHITQLLAGTGPDRG